MDLYVAVCEISVIVERDPSSRLVAGTVDDNSYKDSEICFPLTIKVATKFLRQLYLEQLKATQNWQKVGL